MNVQQIIAQAAARYGLDPATMLRIAQIESSLDPAARNPNSSATGLFQFIDGTWDQYGNGASALDPVANADAAGRYLTDVRRSLTRTLGREPTGWELYLGHQQGPGGASRLFTADPSAPAASVVGNAAINLNAGRPGATVADFLGTWRNKFDGTTPPLSFGQPAAGAEQMFGAQNLSMGTPVAQGLSGLFTPVAPPRAQARPDDTERRRALAALIQ